MRIVIMAPGGKMGKLITKAALNRRNEFMIVGGVVPPDRSYVRQDMGFATDIKFVGAALYGDLEHIIPITEGVIDFSTVECSMEVVKKCVEYRKPLVLGTTGFNERQMAAIKAASKEIPIICAANTSKVVNLMYELLDITSKAIGDQSDIEIIEMHDREKLDAPSGTSKEMGQIIAESRGKQLKEIMDTGRSGKRTEGNIGYHSVRAGNISSTHTVMYGLMGERLEITHHAYDWNCFAEGALDAVKFLHGKPSGLYTFRDVLGFESKKDADEEEHGHHHDHNHDHGDFGPGAY